MNDHAHKILAGISGLSGVGAAYNWLVAHGPGLLTVAGGAGAIIAAGFSIQASRATTRLRKLQKQRLEDE